MYLAQGLFFWGDSSYDYPMRKTSTYLPKRIGLYTQSLVKPVLKARGLMEGKILTHWDQIVGSQYARLSLPEKITFPKGKKTEGTLHLTVTSSASLLLHYAQDVLLEQVNVFFGYKALTKIRMSHGFTPVEAKPSKSSSKPLSEEEIAWVHSQTEGVKDDDLKTCLDQLGVSMLVS